MRGWIWVASFGQSKTDFFTFKPDNMAKPTLNQFTDLRERFKQKREAKKPFEARGSLAQSDKPKRAPKPAHDDRFFNV